MTSKQELLRPLQWLALVLLFSLSAVAADEPVVIRVVGANDGLPLSNQAVAVRMLYRGSLASLQLQTDANGEAHFEIPARKPDNVEIEVDLTGPGFGCSVGFSAKPDAVLRSGVSKGHGHHGNMVSTPGQILLIARPCSFLRRVVIPLASGGD